MSGMTFSEYLNIVRVSEAVKMLSKGNMSAGETAVAAGFGTIRSFHLCVVIVSIFSEHQ